MNREIAERWAEALESGDYVQGQGRLRGDDDTYCCLGVLCELAIRDGVTDGVVPLARGSIIGYRIGRVPYDGMPPREVHEWSGLSRLDAEGYAEMNDTNGESFRTIAEEIRRRNDL